MRQEQLNKNLVLVSMNNKIIIKQKHEKGLSVRKSEVKCIYLTSEEAFKLAYKLMSFASEL